MWSTDSHQHFSSDFGDHASDKPSTSDHKVHGKKGKFNFPFNLCEGNNLIQIFPYMDEASKLLGNLFFSLNCNFQLATRSFPLNPPLVDEVVD